MKLCKGCNFIQSQASSLIVEEASPSPCLPEALKATQSSSDVTAILELLSLH